MSRYAKAVAAARARIADMLGRPAPRPLRKTKPRGWWQCTSCGRPKVDCRRHRRVA